MDTFLDKALEAAKRSLLFVAYEVLVAAIIYRECRRFGIVVEDEQTIFFVPLVLVGGGFLSWHRALEPDRIVMYDQFVHGRVMNPIIESIQAWQHVNRYDLLRWGVFVECGMIQTANFLWVAKSVILGELMKHPVKLPFAVGFALLYQSQFMRYGGFNQFLLECSKASDRYEAGTLVSMPLHLAEFCAGRKLLRQIYLVGLLLRVLIGYPDFVNIPIWWAYVLAGDVGMIAMLFIAHLADADDLHPRDRVNLLEPKQVRIPK